MHFDFPIEKIKFDFEHHGTGQISLYFNNKKIENYLIEHKDINKSNSIKIQFNKDDPADEKSFAVLNSVKINDFDFTEHFKTIPYYINKSKHKISQDKIANTLYFGYIGEMEFNLTHKDDLLTKAAWVIANNEFEYVKWPLRGDNYREKDFNTLHRDAKYMFTGCLAPNTQEINDVINNSNVGELRNPLHTVNDRKKIEDWINNSKRINLQGFEQLEHFTFSQGILDSLNSFILSSEVLYIPKKMYYFHGEILQDKKNTIKDIFNDSILEGSAVLFEFPSPWYSTNEIIDKINEAKDKNCKIALDLTWLSATNELIDLDLNLVDQIFFSMNKTWPIHDLRPAFRWSKQRINDLQTFQYEYCSYPKVAANMFMQLIKQFELDFIYDKYRPSAEQICKTFQLQPTTVLWFTKHHEVKHDTNEYISRYFFLDDFVCLRKLLDFKDKYFW